MRKDLDKPFLRTYVDLASPQTECGFAAITAKKSPSKLILWDFRDCFFFRAAIDHPNSGALLKGTAKTNPMQAEIDLFNLENRAFRFLDILIEFSHAKTMYGRRSRPENL